jgi:hypothetical protein
VCALGAKQGVSAPRRPCQPQVLVETGRPLFVCLRRPIRSRQGKAQSGSLEAHAGRCEDFVLGLVHTTLLFLAEAAMAAEKASEGEAGCELGACTTLPSAKHPRDVWDGCSRAGGVNQSTAPYLR